MRKKLIASIVALSVILALLVAALFYLELATDTPHDGSSSGTTEAAFAETAGATASSDDSTEGTGPEATSDVSATEGSEPSAEATTEPAVQTEAPEEDELPEITFPANDSETTPPANNSGTTPPVGNTDDSSQNDIDDNATPELEF